MTDCLRIRRWSKLPRPYFARKWIWDPSCPCWSCFQGWKVALSWRNHTCDSVHCMDGHLLHWYPRWHQCLCGKGLLHHYSMGLSQVLLEMCLLELRVQCPKEEERREMKRKSIEMLHVNNWQRIAYDFWRIWIVHQCMTYLTLRSFKGTLASFRYKKACQGEI